MALAWTDLSAALDFLASSSSSLADDASPLVIAGQLGLAFLLGCAVACIYVLTQRKSRAEAASLATTLVLLTILITMVTLVIGNNIARAFSLAGALAIVRFRTVVEDTRDTAFVIFAVIVGMGIGAGYVTVSLVGLPIVAFAAWLASQWSVPSTPSREFTLTIRFGIGQDPAAALRPVLDKHLTRVRLQSTATGRQGLALDLVYAVCFREDGNEVALVTELNRVDGVQNVELR